MNTYQVFTPSTPAKLTYVERKSIDEKFRRAINTIGKQIVIYGFSGSGKTTLVNNTIPKYYKNIITTRCIKEMTLEDIFYDAFNQIELFYLSEKEKKQNQKSNFKLETNFLALKTSFSIENSEETIEKIKRIVALKVTPQNLAKYIGDTESCWIIEDFHKIQNSEKHKFSQILKVFMDCSIDYPKLKVITIGAVNTAREIIKYDKEMKNRVSEILVPLMKDDALKRIIERGEELLNIKFEQNVCDKIIRFSSGLPAVTHNLCLITCLNKGIENKLPKNNKYEIKIIDLKESISQFISENQDTYQSIYDKATDCKDKRSYINPTSILNSIIDIEKELVQFDNIKEYFAERINNPNIRKIKEFLFEFTQPLREEVLRHHSSTNGYFFSNPFFKSYVSAIRFEELEKITFTKRLRVEKISKYLEEMDLARQQFLKDFEDFEDELYDYYDED